MVSDHDGGTSTDQTQVTVGSKVMERDNSTLPIIGMLSYVPDTLQSFCERPLLIYSSSAASFTSFNPWALWGANNAVAAKLRNFYMMRGKMHLRCVIQSEPFSYGAGIFYLNPLSYGGVPDTGGDYEEITAGFQNDYSAYLDFASDSQPEIVIPYIDTTNWAVAEQLTSYTRVQIDYQPIVVPESANSSTPSVVTLNFYMFVTDLQVRVPQAQSGSGASVVEEQKPNGLVSSIASKVADAGNILSSVPIIGPFAATASTIASGIASVAKFFGFSKPTMLTDNLRITSRMNGNLALTAGADQSEKLTLDPKCEKSLSYQTLVGTTTDQMSFPYILSHWGYLSTTTWTTSSTEGTNLFATHVAPTIVNTLGNGWIITPMCGVALPFARWTGSIEYKIMVVCSKFHKGRLRIYWNPQVISSDSPLNTTFCNILDIAPGASTTFMVPWSGLTPVRPTGLYALSTPVTTPTGVNNGFFFIDVDQPLVVTRTAASAYIIVLARAGPDFAVYSPTMATLQYMSVVDYQNAAVIGPPTSTVTYNDGTYTPNAQSARSDSVVEVMHQHTNFVTQEIFGEAVGSFRSLVKRYSNYYAFRYESGDQDSLSIVTLDRHPKVRTINSTPNILNYEFTWPAYTALAYYFGSGSLRVKDHIRASNGTQGMVPLTPWTVSRCYGFLNYFIGALDTSLTGITTYTQFLYGNTPAGAMTFPTDSAGTCMMEFEIPDMYGLKVRETSVLLGNATPDYTVQVSCLNDITGNYVFNHNLFYAAGDDYNLYMFKGWPTLYFWAPPLAS